MIMGKLLKGEDRHRRAGNARWFALTSILATTSGDYTDEGLAGNALQLMNKNNHYWTSGTCLIPVSVRCAEITYECH